MNLQHLSAFFWLQWRLRVNQFKKGGTLNAVILVILAVGAVLLSAGLFVLFLALGVLAIGDADWQPRADGRAPVAPDVVMFVWDGFIIAFLFAWMIGLIADLQRSEALSLDRFLHLPVSLSGVFLLNYLSSLLSFTLILFVPAMLGFAIGLVINRGLSMTLLLPLLAAFLLMVTGVTYQFQGWLASLMVNKRRRRTIVVVVTAAFVLLFQLPNLINIAGPWRRDAAGQSEAALRMQKEQAEARRVFEAKEITFEEFQRRDREALERYRAEIQARDRAGMEQFKSVALSLNMVLPPLWLAWGARMAAQGSGLYALLCIAGMTLIGAASLRRAYRTTLRLYTGQFTAGKRQPGAQTGAAPAPTDAGLAGAVSTSADSTADRAAPASARLLEWKLPGVSEQASAIATAGLRSLWRAPEVKMLLISPVIMMIVFGFIFLRRDPRPPDAEPWFEFVPPLMATGAVSMVLLTLIQLVANQFGFDRSGFRVFVLCPASRGDVLLGKNLAVAPLTLILGLFGVVVVQAAYPMRIDRLLALLPQLVSMFLLFCLVGNCVSIMAPMPIAAGTLKPSSSRMLPVLLNIALLFVLPVVIAPTLLPLLVEFVLEYSQITSGIPWCLLLGTLLCTGVVFFYRWLVGWQGAWLQAREQRILEIVAAKAE